MEKRVTTSYIAIDGSIFKTEAACIEYENNMSSKTIKELEFYIKNINDKPISFYIKLNKLMNQLENTRFFDYLWFNIKTKEDYDKLYSVLKTSSDQSKLIKVLKEPSIYPNKLCLEISLPYKLMCTENWRFTGRYIYYTDDINYIEKQVKEYKIKMEG